MTHEGPQLEQLTRRLTETPVDFLAEPRIGKNGLVQVDAVVADLLREFGGTPQVRELAAFAGFDAKKDRNRLATTLLLVWLLGDDWFRSAKTAPQAVLAVLGSAPAELAAQTAARHFVSDPDRREELVRVLLARLDLRPAGESAAQAQDRLTSISATERERFIAAARAAEERARAIRAALAKKAAEESADKYTRE
ncbi:MAG: hypothetical protein HS117_09725 [Verrucomicrobiaceae bacterium]|nr:hypothetical protein [Verrucomicrobiaceae bacterium]